MSKANKPEDTSHLTMQQYVDGRCEELVDVLCQLTYVRETSFGRSPFIRAKNLLSTFRTLFPVTTFLIDNEFFLNRDYYWRDQVIDQLFEQFNGVSTMVIGETNNEIKIKNRYTYDIATDIVDLYSRYAGDFICALSNSINRDTDEQSRKDSIEAIAGLMQTSSILKRYLEEPRQRIYLHGEHLSPFRKTLSKDRFNKNRYVKHGWDYDNVTSFGYSLMGSFLHKQELGTINRNLYKLSKYFIQPVLITLFNELPDIVDDIEKVMRHFSPKDSYDEYANKTYRFRSYPFTARISQWLSEISGPQGLDLTDDGIANRPSYFRDEINLSGGLSRPNPFESYRWKESDQYLDGVVDTGRRTNSTNTYYDVNSLELAVLYGHSQMGLGRSLN